LRGRNRLIAKDLKMRRKIERAEAAGIERTEENTRGNADSYEKKGVVKIATQKMLKTNS